MEFIGDNIPGPTNPDSPRQTKETGDEEMNPTTLTTSNQSIAEHAQVAVLPMVNVSRIVSLDIIRGIVMVLMAIDHVRVFSGLPGGGPAPGIFFTRWVTNFCAPIFVFLAGTGAYLYGQKHKSAAAVSRYLAIRGAWLVLLELTFLRLAWTFNVDYSSYILAGVIWMIGWCMILLALLVRLPIAVLTVLSLLVIAGHNIIDHFSSQFALLLSGKSAWIWQILYFGGYFDATQNGPTISVLYSIVPWIGVMAGGYAFGVVMKMDSIRRKRICLYLGIISIVLFLFLRGFNLYGDPRPWKTTQHPATGASSQSPSAQSASSPQQNSKPQNGSSRNQSAQPASPPKPRRQMPSALAFLNTTKYPASLLFLLMTLGPMFLAVVLLEDNRSRIGNFFSTFGRVPLFYYILHIPTIHLAALVVCLIRTGSISPWLFSNHPTGNPLPPPGYVWGLPLLYLVFVVVIVMLYFPCRWFARVRKDRQSEWLSFL